MTFSILKHLQLLGIAVVCVTAVPTFANADFIVNGGFGSGLTGWSVAGDAGKVTATGGVATIVESATALETDLYQDFVFAANTTTVTFKLVAVFADSASQNSVTPDSFGVAILNPVTGDPLVSTVNNTTDSYYIRDLTTDATQGDKATGVTVSSDNSFPITITIDTSALGGTSARLLFRVIGGGDRDSTSSVSIDEVVGTPDNNGPPSSTPAPATLILAAIGAFGCAGKAWWSRRRRLSPACSQELLPAI
jgi:hypothetical protein